MKRSYGKLLALVLVGMGSSCSAVYEDLDPCQQNVGFVYDYNMSFADAFPSSLTDMNLYVFNQDSLFVTTYSGSAMELSNGMYGMPVSMPAGTYHLVAWGGNTDDLYETSPLTEGVSSMKDFSVRLRRQENGQLQQKQGLGNLLQGVSSIEIDSTDHSQATVHLMNNTKQLVFLIQTEDGDTLHEGDYRFSITANNGKMAFNNELLDDDPVIYTEFFKNSLSQDGLDVLKAEVNTLRLMADQEARLQIFANESKGNILDIDLVAYLKMFKSTYYNNMSDQEWLDRNSSFNIVFFLDQRTGMITTLQIGPWKIVLVDTDL